MAQRYEFYVFVERTISHSFASLTREILFLPLEHKIHIFSPPCNILYLFYILCHSILDQEFKESSCVIYFFVPFFPQQSIILLIDKIISQSSYKTSQVIETLQTDRLAERSEKRSNVAEYPATSSPLLENGGYAVAVRS